MKLYHATTPKKIKRYKNTGVIFSPVRGFTTLLAAITWARRVGRTIILEFEAVKPHKLPDHHNTFGQAWWEDNDVRQWTCVYGHQYIDNHIDNHQII